MSLAMLLSWGAGGLLPVHVWVLGGLSTQGGCARAPKHGSGHQHGLPGFAGGEVAKVS